MTSDFEAAAQAAWSTLRAGGVVCLRSPAAFVIFAAEGSAVERVRSAHEASGFPAEWAVLATPEVAADVALPFDAEFEAHLPLLLARFPLRTHGPENPASRLLLGLDRTLRELVSNGDGISTFRPTTDVERAGPLVARITALAFAEGRLVFFVAEQGCSATELALLDGLAARIRLDLALECGGL